MKTFNKLFTAFAVFSALIFSSCTDPVFYYINRDVKSEEATVFGVIRSIARYENGGEEYLVTVGSNGIIYKRVCAETEAHGTWITVSESELPFAIHKFDYTDASHKGEQILKIVADTTTLYAVTVQYGVNLDEGSGHPEKFHIWAVQPEKNTDGNWKPLTAADWTDVLTDAETKSGDNYLPIYFNDSDGLYYTAFNVFSTNSPKAANREVYVRIGGGAYKNTERAYYQISGTTISAASITNVEDSSSGASDINVNSCVKGPSGTLFFNTEVSATNETNASDATKVYFAEGTYLKYGVPGSYSTSVNVDHTITAMAVCKDAIIIGCGQPNSSNTSISGGVEKVQLDGSGIPSSTLGTFTTNAKTQLLNYYRIDYLFNTDPSKSELESALYAGMSFIGSGTSSSVSYNNIGLWSYYPSRGNWNRE